MAAFLVGSWLWTTKKNGNCVPKFCSGDHCGCGNWITGRDTDHLMHALDTIDNIYLGV
jgi:hypothetical protein